MSEDLTGSGSEEMDRADESIARGSRESSESRQEGRGGRGGQQRGDEERPRDRGADRSRTSADDIDSSMRARGDEDFGEVY